MEKDKIGGKIPSNIIKLVVLHLPYILPTAQLEHPGQHIPYLLATLLML
jgi:hypothetical protein